MGVNENIATVRGDAAKLSQAFFVYFFKKYPQHLNSFPAYKDKSPDSLPSVSSFASHTLKVTSMALEVAENAGDAAKLAAYAKKLKDMPQHKGLNADAFRDVYAALVEFLKETIGGATDVAGWNAASAKIVAALKSAGF